MAEAVSIRLFGDDMFKRRILAMRYRARNMSPVLEDIGHDWLAMTEEQFATEGARGGHPWAPLARSTRLRRKDGGHPILVRTATLLIEASGPDNLHVTDDEVTLHFPSGVEPRARAHQYGFDNAQGGGHVPARPLVDFTDLDRRRWRNKITRFLVQGRLP